MTATTTTCPFCAATAARHGASRHLQYPVWRCACGGVGVGASPMDVDESLDELEALLEIPRGTFGAPTTPAPVGTSGFLHASYIDPEAMVAGAIASAPVGWAVGSSRATIEARNLGDPSAVRPYELLVVWARQV